MVDQKASWDSSELENLFFLRGVDFGSVRGLLEECPLRVLKPEEILLQAGERNESLYLLLSGRLRIHLQLDADPITILNPGDVVGVVYPLLLWGIGSLVYLVAGGRQRGA